MTGKEAPLTILSPSTVLKPDGRRDLVGDWFCCALPPGSVSHPDRLHDARPEWLPALVPGTVASSLQALGRWIWTIPWTPMPTIGGTVHPSPRHHCNRAMRAPFVSMG